MPSSRTTVRSHVAAVTTTALVAGLAASAIAASPGPGPGTMSAAVAAVVDGDTIALAGGTRVRLLQIDTPEIGGGECYSRAAARVLRALLPPGAQVRLEPDPRLDRADRYGRLLRYAWAGGRNVNLELVRRGAATVWFYGGIRGRYAAELLSAARSARAARTGLWGACREARWNPYQAASTGPGSKTVLAAGRTGAGTRCDRSYPDVCIAPAPPDLDCSQVPFRRFRVLPPDPHRFDGDRDGIGCESRP